MSWLYSRALVEEYLAATCSAGEQSARWNLQPGQQAFLPSDRMTDFSRPFRYGMTFAPLTEPNGEELLTWYLEASHARTSASPAQEKGLTESVQDSGQKWPASSMKYDRDTRSWRTAQHSLLGGLDEFSGTWPRWGSMRNGECWERQTLAHRTAENESGLWPTPTVCGNHNRKGSSATSGDGLATAVKSWPTPTASLGTKGGRVTPRKSREGGTLIEAVSSRTFATPTARDWRSGKASEATMERNSRPLSEQIGGQLNPNWVEWLMGWPPGWTDLKPLVMDKFRNAQHRHGGF